MKYILVLILIISSSISFSQSTFNLDRDWGTYFGDNRFSLQNSQTDSEGNLYIVGYVWGQFGDITEDFNYFDNAPHQSNYSGGVSDGFVAKFNPQGSLVWATLFGGENADVIEGVTIDKNNHIYIMGFTDSETGISTPNAYQTHKQGYTSMFISKFTSTGSIAWSTYYGDSSTNDVNLISFAKSNFLNTDADGNYIVHDGGSNLYITSSLGYIGTESATIPPIDNLNGTGFVGKFTDTGNFVWSTFYGINSSEISGVCYCNNALYITGDIMSLPNSQYPTNSTYYATPNAYQSTASNMLTESFLAKFDDTGTRVWGTYYGGNSSEQMSGNNLACDNQSNLFHVMGTISENMASPQAYQEDKIYGNTPMLTKFEDTSSGVNPARAWATYYGLGENSEPNGSSTLSVAFNDKSIYISGETGWSENIASDGSWQETVSTAFGKNAFVAKFNQSGERIWGTYYNGEGASSLVKVLPYGNTDNFYLVGTTESISDMTTSSGVQPEHIAIDNEYWQSAMGTGNIFITHFSPETDSVGGGDVGLIENINQEHNVLLFPNPASSYAQLKWNTNGVINNAKYNIVDLSGRVIVKAMKMEVNNGFTTIDLAKLSDGVYFVNVYEQEELIVTKKLIVKK